MKTLIDVKEAADLLCLAPKTLYSRKAGTDKLTRVKLGKRALRFVLEEVEELIEEKTKTDPRRKSQRNEQKQN